MGDKVRNNYRWLALLTVSIGTYMGTLDASIVNISLPRLTEVFNTEPSVVLWVTVAYLLASVGLMLAIGKVGDLFGRKRVYVSGFVLFTIGLTLCAVAQSIVQLILARVVQALGSAMVVALGNAIVTDAFPQHERGKALGLVGAMVSTGLLSGPVIGGFLLDALDWRAIFWVRIPVGVIGLTMGWTLLREQTGESSRPGFDWGGAASLFGGLSCLLLFFNFGGRMGFATAPVLALATSTVVLLAVFIILERKAQEPILSLDFFRNRAFAAGITSMLIMFLAISAHTFLMPFYLIQGTGRTAAEAGLLFATVSATSLVVGPVSGWLSDKTGSRVLCTVGMALMATALFLLSRLDIQSDTPAVLMRLAVLGLGMGLFSSPNNSSVMGSVPRQNLSTASAMIATTRQIGMSCGIAIAGTIFAAREAFHAAQLTAGEFAPAMLERLALVNGFQDSLVYAAAFCTIGIVASLVRGRTVPPMASLPVPERPRAQP